VSGGFGWTHGIVVFVYCATMAAVGIRMAGRQRTTDDYFLAGRGLPWLAVAMSMYASVTSAVTGTDGGDGLHGGGGGWPRSSGRTSCSSC